MNIKSNKFETSFTWTLGKEGAFVHNIDGYNLYTLFGITQKYNPNWEGWAIVEQIIKDHPKDYKEIINKNTELKALAQKRYRNKYWETLWEELPIRFGLVFFDMRVQHGRRLDKEIQKLIKRKLPKEVAEYEAQGKKFVDSYYGKTTQKYLLKMLNQYGEMEILFQLLLERLDLFVDWAEYKNKKHLYFGTTKHRVRDLYMEILKSKYNEG